MATPEKPAQKSRETAQMKRKSSDADSGKERGERGGRKRSRSKAGEDIKAAEATAAVVRRETDRRVYQYSISEGVGFQPCEQPYEVESSGAGLGFNFWMKHRGLLTEDLQDVLVASALGDALPPYLRDQQTPKQTVVVCAQGVCPITLAQALPRCEFLSSCSSLPLRHATTHGKQWRPSEAVHAASLLMWSQFPTVPFRELQHQSVVDILNSYTCVFEAEHPQWRDSVSLAAADVRTHPKFVQWQTENEGVADQVEAAGKFFRDRIPSSGVWLFCQGKLLLLWNRWDPEELVVGPWEPNSDKKEDHACLMFRGQVDLDQKQLPFTLELVCAMRAEAFTTSGGEDGEEHPLVADKYNVAADGISAVLAELEPQCRDRLHELLISYEHMTVLGYPRDGRADGYLDLSRASPAPDTLHAAEESEEGEVSDSDEGDLASAATAQATPQAQHHAVVAVDCEMCYTDRGLELTRLSLVSGSGGVIYDEYVRPTLPIINYNTEYSGITEEHMKSATKSLIDVQHDLRQMLSPRTVLVGHSIDSDLKAMQLVHNYIIDTAACYPHPKGPPFKHSLKSLIKRLFGIEIQGGSGTTGHDSVQDAQMALLLAYTKILEGEQFCVGTPSEAYFPRRQLLPAHIDAVMQSRSRSRSEASERRYRLACSTVAFNKLWERSLDGQSLAGDVHYCLQQMDTAGVVEREETPTSIRLRSDKAAIDCVKHSTGFAALNTFISQLKQASPKDEAPSLFYLDLPCSISAEVDPLLRSRHASYPILPGTSSSGASNLWGSANEVQAAGGFELVRTTQALEESLQAIHAAMPAGALLMVVTQGEIQDLKHSMVWKLLSKWDNPSVQPTAGTAASNGSARTAAWDDDNERELTILAAHALSGAVFLRVKK